MDVKIYHKFRWLLAIYFLFGIGFIAAVISVLYVVVSDSLFTAFVLSLTIVGMFVIQYVSFIYGVLGKPIILINDQKVAYLSYYMIVKHIYLEDIEKVVTNKTHYNDRVMLYLKNGKTEYIETKYYTISQKELTKILKQRVKLG